jgi:hypothetical protein
MNITIVVYLIFLVAGLGFIYFAFRQKSKAKLAGETWPTVPGKVMDSRVASHTSFRNGRQSTQIAAVVKYEYQVMGQAYESDTLGFGNTGSGRKNATAKVAEYPAGSSVTVHYDPADPSKAVLETKAYGFVTNLLIAAFLIVLGVGGLLLSM